MGLKAIVKYIIFECGCKLPPGEVKILTGYKSDGRLIRHKGCQIHKKRIANKICVCLVCGKTIVCKNQARTIHCKSCAKDLRSYGMEIKNNPSVPENNPPTLKRKLYCKNYSTCCLEIGKKKGLHFPCEYVMCRGYVYQPIQINLNNVCDNKCYGVDYVDVDCLD